MHSGAKDYVLVHRSKEKAFIEKMTELAKETLMTCLKSSPS